MTDREYDVVIIGGGNAGMGVTVPTREAGLSVAMIESWDLGGTCPNRGCTPKKVLVAAAHALHEIDRASEHGITVGTPSLDWAKLIDREKAMIAGIPESLGKLMDSRGVDVFRGNGAFVGPNRVQVGEDVLTGKHIVIATGSTPRRLPFPGADLMSTSDDVLDRKDLPDSVVFVGGGVIAMEFSHVYARAGATVTILEALPQALPALEPEAVALLVEEGRRLGIEIQTGVTVQGIEKDGDRFLIAAEIEGSAKTFDAAMVVNGAGRVANVEGLGIEAANVEHDRGRISVDGHLRSTSNPAVFVCGDALAISPQLSPVATYEGQFVGRAIVDGPENTPDYASIPSAVYTVPALASVGLTEKQAADRSLQFRKTTTDMSGWFSSRTYAETAAWAKVLIEEPSDRILGAHILGHAGEELVHLFALAIRHDITATQLKQGIFGFPTFSSDIKNLL